MKFFLSLVLCLTSAVPAFTAEDRIAVERVKRYAFEPSPENMAASYRITTQNAEGNTVGAATGVAIDARTILTAGHVASVIELNPDVKFLLDIFSADGEYSYSIALHLDRYNNPDLMPNIDLALFHTDEEVPHTTLHYAKRARVGEWIYTLGARYGEAPYCVGWGELASKTSREFSGLWLATINPAPGNSGGGVWNSKHEFLGILVRGAPSLTLFVPAQTVHDFIEGVDVSK